MVNMTMYNHMIYLQGFNNDDVKIISLHNGPICWSLVLLPCEKTAFRENYIPLQYSHITRLLSIYCYLVLKIVPYVCANLLNFAFAKRVQEDSHVLFMPQ